MHDLEGTTIKSPKNSNMLKELFQECVIPRMHHIQGKPKSRVDTGLDSLLHNFKIAERRNKEREKELQQRMSNPLTYPSKGETLKDQYRAIPSESTMKKLNSKGKRPVMGSI